MVGAGDNNSARLPQLVSGHERLRLISIISPFIQSYITFICSYIWVKIGLKIELQTLKTGSFMKSEDWIEWSDATNQVYHIHQLVCWRIFMYVSEDRTERRQQGWKYDLTPQTWKTTTVSFIQMNVAGHIKRVWCWLVRVNNAFCPPHLALCHSGPWRSICLWSNSISPWSWSNSICRWSKDVRFYLL